MFFNFININSSSQSKFDVFMIYASRWITEINVGVLQDMIPVYKRPCAITSAKIAWRVKKRNYNVLMNKPFELQWFLRTVEISKRLVLCHYKRLYLPSLKAPITKLTERLKRRTLICGSSTGKSWSHFMKLKLHEIYEVLGEKYLGHLIRLL